MFTVYGGLLNLFILVKYLNSSACCYISVFSSIQKTGLYSSKHRAICSFLTLQGFQIDCQT